ncbi:hypothetical protein ACE7GA_22395 [Roseomonas sp. CCTCC AB2023176]|uniref:hypothetical protein n=1 Tax=Roseomonas sp. CCTCC AB2023176 TaxID=3342640 RepID=UPI0035DBB47F
MTPTFATRTAGIETLTDGSTRSETFVWSPSLFSRPIEAAGSNAARCTPPTFSATPCDALFGATPLLTAAPATVVSLAPCGVPVCVLAPALACAWLPPGRFGSVAGRGAGTSAPPGGPFFAARALSKALALDDPAPDAPLPPDAAPLPDAPPLPEAPRLEVPTLSRGAMGAPFRPRSVPGLVDRAQTSIVRRKWSTESGPVRQARAKSLAHKTGRIAFIHCSSEPCFGIRSRRFTECDFGFFTLPSQMLEHRGNDRCCGPTPSVLGWPAWSWHAWSR